MKTLTQALLFAATTLPLFAQHAHHYQAAALPPARKPAAVEPVVIQAPPLEVRLGLERGKHLEMTLSTTDGGGTWIGVVLASTSDSVITIDALPPLLVAEAIVAAGVGKGPMSFDMGPVMLPFSVMLQGVAITESRIGASEITELPPAQ